MTLPLHHFPQKETQLSNLHPVQKPVHGRAEVFSRVCLLLMCHQDLSLHVGHSLPSYGLYETGRSHGGELVSRQ